MSFVYTGDVNKCINIYVSWYITESAYDVLKRLKHGDESFSEVIMRISKDKIGTTSKFLGALKISNDESEKWKKNIKESRKTIESDIT